MDGEFYMHLGTEHALALNRTSQASVVARDTLRFAMRAELDQTEWVGGVGNGFLAGFQLPVGLGREVGWGAVANISEAFMEGSTQPKRTI